MKIKLFSLLAIFLLVLCGCEGNQDSTKIMNVNNIIEKDNIAMVIAFTHSETSATDKAPEINYYYEMIENLKLNKFPKTKAKSFITNYEFGLEDTTVSIIDKDDNIYLIHISSNNEFVLIDQRIEEVPDVYKIEFDNKTEEFIEAINDFLKENK